MQEPLLRAGRLGASVVLAISLAACGPGASTTAPATASPDSTAPGSSVSAVPSVAASPAASVASSPVASDGQEAGETRVDAFGIGQVWVPAGTFTMGTDAGAIAALTAAGPPPWIAGEFPSEQPAHEVRLTTGYWIDTDEVTNKAFAVFVAAGGYTTQAYWSIDGWGWLGTNDATRLPLHCQGDVPEHPRMCITWYEAEAYAHWRDDRLPTEAEWEYPARGPESLVYPWGNAFDIDRTNVINSIGPKPVGSYANGSSWIGARDMAGNAMEWVSDWLDIEYYATSPKEDPKGPGSGAVKVEKGGWWGSNEFVARSSLSPLRGSTDLRRQAHRSPGRLAVTDRIVVAMGGGGFSMEPEVPLLDDHVLDLARANRGRE